MSTDSIHPSRNNVTDESAMDTNPLDFNEPVETIPNGHGAAAILAAGIGCAMVGILALAGDAWKSVNAALTFYKPSGALSGVTTVAILVWLASWFVFGAAWRTKNVNMVRINVIAFALLVVGLLLTFPPFMDLLQGK